MAHSIQTFRGKSKVINDIDLLVLMVFAMRLMRQLGRFEGIRDCVERWEEAIRGYGPGVIDLELEEFANSPVRVLEFNTLWTAVADTVSEYGDVIPADLLNKELSITRVTFYEGFKVSFVKEAAKELDRLLAES